jgi:hypothetical protein
LDGDVQYRFVKADGHVRGPSTTAEAKIYNACVGKNPSTNKEHKHISGDQGHDH